MRPRKLTYEDEEILASIYDKLKTTLKKKKSCNQFYIASQLKKLFDIEPDWNGLVLNKEAVWYKKNEWGMDKLPAIAEKYSRGKDIEQIKIEELAKYFDVDKGYIWSLHYYLKLASPAAIVQMIKRIKNRYKTIRR